MPPIVAPRLECTIDLVPDDPCLRRLPEHPGRDLAMTRQDVRYDLERDLCELDRRLAPSGVPPVEQGQQGAVLGAHDVHGVQVVVQEPRHADGIERRHQSVDQVAERDRELYTQMAATNSIEAAVELLEGTRYHDVVQNALEQRQSDSLQPIEDALDRAYYENLVSSLPAGGAAGRVYRGFVQTQIDVTNLKTVMRLRHRGLTGLGELLIEGGTLDESALATTSSVADILPIIEGTTFQEVLQPVLEDFEDGGLNRAVQALENHVATQSRRYAYLHPLSILPILDYLLRKEKEVRNLRTIVRGRELELSREKIEELLVV